MGEIILNKFRCSEYGLDYYFDCSEELKPLFNDSFRDDDGLHLFVRFNQHNLEIPDEDKYIPFLGTVFGVAIATDATIHVPTVGSVDKASFEKLCFEFNKLFDHDFSGVKIEAGVIDNRRKEFSNKRQKTALFFTGGLDATSALYQILDEHPLLINIDGADIELDDADAHIEIERYFKKIASKFKLEYLFIRSNCRWIINEFQIDKCYLEQIDPCDWHGYWASIAHTVVTAAVSSVVLNDNNIDCAFFGSTYPISKTTTFDANHVDVLHELRFCSCAFKQIDEDTRRIDKIKTVKEFKIKYDFYPVIHVCWNKTHGENCSKCSKCYRTILEFLLKGENPNDYGFTYDDKTNSEIQKYLSENITNEAFIGEICNEARLKDEKWLEEHDLKWLLAYDYKANAVWYPPNINIHGSTVVIYGAGDVGHDYLNYIRSKFENSEILIVDEKYEDSVEIEGYIACSPTSIIDSKYDCVVIAIYDDNVREEVMKKLINDLNVNGNLIYAERPKRCFGGIDFAKTL